MMTKSTCLGALCLCGAFAVMAAGQRTNSMTTIAREYVRLVLALGKHDKDYVDAYYGPDDIKREAESAKLTLDAIASGVKALEGQVAAIPRTDDQFALLRLQYLGKQLSAMSTRVSMLKGQ